MRQLEICVDSFEAARTAQRGGADRLELCGDLSLGGLTPDPGLLERVLSELTIPVQVMIRPRGGGFIYTEDELDTMEASVRVIRRQWPGIRGFVTGALRPEGGLHREALERFQAAAGPCPLTVHRAFDQAGDPAEALALCIGLGIERVLTSGGEGTAEAGIPRLAALQRQGDGRIVILPGGGVTPQNAARILRETGVTELHLSARKARPLGPRPEDRCHTADPEVIRQMRLLLDR